MYEGGKMKAAWTFEEMLAYHVEEAAHWKSFFLVHPASLDLAVDIAGAKTVRQVLLHITFVELRYAQGVNGVPIGQIPDKGKLFTIQELFSYSEEAVGLFREALRSHNDDTWELCDDFSRIRPGFKVSRRKMFLQAMTHSLRHYAQLATFLRQSGFKQDWMHDLLFTETLM
jgi:uncharacterized damage-inducible protein DinB